MISFWIISVAVISSQSKYSPAQTHTQSNNFLLFSGIPLFPRCPDSSGGVSKTKGQAQTEPVKVVWIMICYLSSCSTINLQSYRRRYWPFSLLRLATPWETDVRLRGGPCNHQQIGNAVHMTVCMNILCHIFVPDIWDINVCRCLQKPTRGRQKSRRTEYKRRPLQVQTKRKKGSLHQQNRKARLKY